LRTQPWSAGSVGHSLQFADPGQDSYRTLRGQRLTYQPSITDHNSPSSLCLVCRMPSVHLTHSYLQRYQQAQASHAAMLGSLYPSTLPYINPLVGLGGYMGSPYISPPLIPPYHQYPPLLTPQMAASQLDTTPGPTDKVLTPTQRKTEVKLGWGFQIYVSIARDADHSAFSCPNILWDSVP